MTNNNRFVQKKKEEYDYTDNHGRGWRLKKGESLEELKDRAAGKKKVEEKKEEKK